MTSVTSLEQQEKRCPADEIPLAPFTTYLGYLLKERDPAFFQQACLTRKTLQLHTLVPRDILGEYEAVLTHCCYFARLAYENRPRTILRGFDLVQYSPLVFNKGLSLITHTKQTDTKIESSPATKKPKGYFFYDSAHDNPASIALFDYSKIPSIMFHSGEKVVYIIFRGTISLANILKDLNIAPASLFQVFGNELFAEEKAEEDRRASTVPAFGAHAGFITGLAPIFPRICARLTTLLEENPGITRICIMGQSLGGAYASIMALGLAQMKKKGTIPGLAAIPIHAMTYGAPKIFHDYSRNVFNQLLLDGYFTFDRVTTRPRFPDPTLQTFDPIPLIPQHLNHPGFMILKPEIKTQSRTGRTKHASELRSELAGIVAKKSLLTSMTSRNYNPLPDYLECFNKFMDSYIDPSFTVDEYKYLLETSALGTVRIRRGPAAKVFAITEGVLGLTTAQADAATEKAAVEGDRDVQAATAAGKAAADDPALAAAATDQKETDALVKQGYGPAMPPAEGGAWNPSVKKKLLSTQTPQSNTSMYKALTVAHQPNHVVYNCSIITSGGLPGPGCHAGYMGVSYLAMLANFGSGTLTGARDYVKEATMYCTDDGTWTYLPDSDTRYSNSSATRGGSAFRPKRATRSMKEKVKAKHARNSTKPKHTRKR